MKDIDVIDAFDHWWNSRPEPHIPAPRHCHMKMQQDRMLAIWISAWNAAKQHSAWDAAEQHNKEQKDET